MKLLKKFTILMSLIYLSALSTLIKADEIALDPSLLSLSQATGQMSDTPMGESLTPFFIEHKLTDNTLFITIAASNQAYIYKDSIKAESDDIKFFASALPSGRKHSDFQGDHEVYFDKVTFELQILKSLKGNSIEIEYQGCDKSGICYPPQIHSIVLDRDIDSGLSDIKTDTGIKDTVLNNEDSLFATGADSIASSLTEKSFLSLFICFALGCALMLTPCVLPMLPIFSAMIIGAKNTKLIDSIILNLSYASGLSLTYMILGLLFASLGSALNSFLQNSYVTLSIAVLFVIFALSSAGLFDIKMPSSVSNLISDAVSKQKRGVLLSAFFFGLLSAILSTPCTSAPLAGALLFVLKSGDILFGALAFLAIGLGMAFPLFLIGIFGAKLMPKSSALSIFLKRLIALPLFLAAWYIAKTPLSDYEHILNAAAIFVSIGYGIFIIGGIFYSKVRTLSTLSLCIGFIVAFAITANLNKAEHKNNMTEEFVAISSIDDLKHFKDKKIFIDFHASWCTNCKVMEKDIFSDDAFINMARDSYHLLSFDITDSKDEKVKAMIEHFEVIGVPYIVVTDETLEVKDRHIGFADKDRMLRFIERNKQ